jgi:hypothetical protein
LPGEGEVGRDLHEIAPFGRAWPGLAPAGARLEDPAVVAAWYAGQLVDGTARLGLVVADRGADARGHRMARPRQLRPGDRAADRTRAQLGRPLSRPDRRYRLRDPASQRYRTPVTAEHALQVAAEHFAFSTDTILAGLIGFEPHPLAGICQADP